VRTGVKHTSLSGKVPPVNRAGFTCRTGRGKTYYLPAGPKRGGGIQYVSTDPKGPAAEAIPEGVEIHETPNAQVYLRKKKPALIQPAELELVERQTNQHCCLAEVSRSSFTKATCKLHEVAA
jgi:hypothetical protein